MAHQFYSLSKPSSPSSTPSKSNTLLLSKSPTDLSVDIGEGDFKRVFDEIASCIHLDEENDRAIIPHDPKNEKIPYLYNRPLATPESSHIQSLNVTPHSRSRDIVVDSPGDSCASFSPARRAPGRNGVDPFLFNSPASLSTKSFLDDDWLRERVRFDHKMAQVAGGLVRSASPTLTSDNDHDHDHDESVKHLINRGHRPPNDYVCKLCNVPGHWLKDCQYFEPRLHNANGSNASFSRFFGQNKNNSEHVVARNLQPPGNYICRLCGVPGHWIEKCSKFQPKHLTTFTQFSKADFGNNGRWVSGPPPKNYICNLCHQPGHWIQQCSEFQPLPFRRQKFI